MQWDGTPAGGLTAKDVRPWLPYGDHATRNVAAQRDDSGSVLRPCRGLIALRSAEFRERIASYRQLPAPPGVWAFQADRLQVTANFSDTPVLACSTAGALAGVTLAPWSGVIIGPAS